MTLLQMSLSGAVLIAVILFIRVIALHKLPKWAFLVLWWIALLRLVLPAQLPAPWSVYSLWDRMRQPAQEHVMEVLSSGQVDTVAGENDPYTLDMETSAVNTAGNGSLSEEDFPVVRVVWLLGMTVSLTVFAVLYLRSYSLFRRSLPVEDEFIARWLTERRPRRKVSVRQSDRIRTPLTYGVLHPVILLPKEMDISDRDQMEFILAHEYVHILRLDAVTKLVLSAVVSVHWFNPAVWGMMLFFNRDLELACDERVLRSRKEDARADYASTLIRMAEQRSMVLPLGNGFGKNAIEERIRSIMKFKKISFAMIAAAVILVGGVTAVFATSAEAGSQEESSAVTSTENAEGYKIPDRVDFSKEAELLRSYEEYSVSYDKAGIMYYQGQPVRYLWDGYDVMENGKVIGQSIRYEYLNEDGVIDVRVIRDLEQYVDGAARIKGIAGIEPYSQEEFDSRDIDELKSRPIAVAETDSTETYDGGETATENEASDNVYTIGEDNAPVTVAEAVSDDEIEWGNSSNADYFRQFEPYGIRYKETEEMDGTSRVVYFADIPVKKFVDIRPDGGVTVFDSSIKEGITVQTLYASGKLSGVELRDEDYEAEQKEWWQETLSPYLPFGLTYDYDEYGNANGYHISMYYDGKEVRGILDSGQWIAEHLGYAGYSGKPIDLYVVYENGQIVGLREVEPSA